MTKVFAIYDTPFGGCARICHRIMLLTQRKFCAANDESENRFVVCYKSNEPENLINP